MMPTLKVSSDQEGKRLDIMLSRAYPAYSRSFMQRWIKNGNVSLAGELLGPNYRVHPGETIEVADFDVGAALVAARNLGPDHCGRPQGPPLQLPRAPKILFEDDSLLVINKPAGLVVHPAPSHKGPTLVDWLKNHLGPQGSGAFADEARLGLVHRLDKDTSGVLLIAKTPIAQNALSRQFHDRQVKKRYAAFLEGVPKAAEGIISAPVGRSRRSPNRMAVSSLGRPSETSFAVEEKWTEVSLVKLFPKTGRTHQIRVHCAAMGHPIIGDRTYGARNEWSEKYGIDRPMLHAERLEFYHPSQRRKMSVEAPWPADMKQARALFRKTMKVLVVVISLWTMSLTVKAESASTGSSGPSKRKTPHSTSGGSSSSSSSAVRAMKKEMASIREQFKSLIEEVSALQDRVTSIQAALDELGASKRLRDLEKAVSDVNGKVTNASNTAEEAKSQSLDLGRKLKTQQETLEQLRDQLGRLQRELNDTKARQEMPASTPREGGPGTTDKGQETGGKMQR
jgi:23S rRNA pseudouridine1911/1915/1917 synthase